MTTNDRALELDPDERRIRNMLRRRVDGVAPLPQQPALKQWMIPAPPAHPPTIPAPAAATPPATNTPTRGGARLPDWRHKKPALVLVKDDPDTDTDVVVQDDENNVEEPDQEQPTAPTTDAPPPEYVVELRAGLDEIATSVARIAERVTADPKRRRHLATGIYNVAAAGAGYVIGIAPWALERLGHYGHTDPREGVVIGAGLIVVCAVAEIRTHRWRGHDRHPVVRALGWIARIPLASAVLALALYGPNATL